MTFHGEDSVKSLVTRFLVTPFLVLFVLACLVQALHSQTPKQTAEDSNRFVKATGCVKPGVEASCLVLFDLKTHKTYNLFFTGDKPQIDTVIEFEGMLHDGTTICMQGAPVNVKKWTPLKVKCTIPA